MSDRVWLVWFYGHDAYVHAAFATKEEADACVARLNAPIDAGNARKLAQANSDHRQYYPYATYGVEEMPLGEREAT